MSQFTLNDALKLCEKAKRNFEINCLDKALVSMLQTLTYSVKLNSRLRIMAGKARKITKHGKVTLLMELNQRLLERESEEERFQTVSHELAHLLDFAIRGRSDHKDYWRNLHRMMGGDAKRCHTYDTTGMRNRVRRVLLTDTQTGQEYLLTKRRYSSMISTLMFANLAENGRYKTKWLSPEQVMEYIKSKTP